MDKQSEKLDKLTHQLINDAGLENPSSDFFSNVMDEIENKTSSQPIVYQPLISLKMWLLLIALTIIVLALLQFFPGINSGAIYQLPSLNNLSFKLPEIHLSKTAIYGIGFLSLFLIQIPFLKKQIDQRF
jgi:hypothetical protein